MTTPRKNIFVNIFPEAGKSYILISWLRSDSSYFVNYKEQFEEIMNLFLFGTSKIKNIGMEIEKNLVKFKCQFDLFKQ